MAAKRFLAALLFVLVAACTPSAASSPPTIVTATPPAPTLAPTTAPTPTAAPAFPVTITDDEGTAVTIPAEPKRIVSLTPATTETLFAIGAGGRIVGKVQDIASFPPEANGIPEVATFAGVDVEKIVDLSPDLVISGGTGLTQGDAVTKLRAAKIPVIVSYPTKVGTAIAGIRTIGKAVGLMHNADALADKLEDQITKLQSLTAGATTKPRVFYEIDTTGGIFTPPVDSIYGELFTIANAEQIGGNASYQISLEELVAKDPEVILLGDAAYGATADAVRQRAGWNGMTAVKNGAIFPIDDIVVTRPGPRIVDGLAALIKAIHPELDVCPALGLPCPTPAAPAAS